jgi:hypothetical protein
LAWTFQLGRTSTFEPAQRVHKVSPASPDDVACQIETPAAKLDSERSGQGGQRLRSFLRRMQVCPDRYIEPPQPVTPVQVIEAVWQWLLSGNTGQDQRKAEPCLIACILEARGENPPLKPRCSVELNKIDDDSRSTVSGVAQRFETR